MPDLIKIIANWWKQVLAVVILSLIAVGIITFLKPVQYLSVTTAIASSSVSADKSKVFNENIEYLYSDLGSPDDLDKIVGTAKLDTIYLAVTDQFNLFDHYKISQVEKNPRWKAAQMLMKNSRVLKSDYGELKIKVWDTDKELAPQLTNAILNQLSTIYQDLQSAANRSTLLNLQAASNKIKNQLDSLGKNTGTTNDIPELKSIRSKSLQGQWEQYMKLMNEYQFMLDNKQPVLMVVEKARAAIRPDRPRRFQILLSTFFLSFLFAILAAIVIEGRKK